MSALPPTMTEEMLNAAHEAAYASRHLPWREAEQARWRAVLAVMPQQNDADRLVWAMSHMGSGNYHRQFASHVLSVGGVGDLGDCRAFIDGTRSAEAASNPPR